MLGGSEKESSSDDDVKSTAAAMGVVAVAVLDRDERVEGRLRFSSVCVTSLLRAWRLPCGMLPYASTKLLRSLPTSELLLRLR